MNLEQNGKYPNMNPDFIQQLMVNQSIIFIIT